MKPNKKDKTVKYLTSVFNIPDIEQQQDYKKMYQKQKKLRQYYQKKYNDATKQIKKYFKQNKNQYKGSYQRTRVMDQIKSFKCLLPNSIKEIQIDDSFQVKDGFIMKEYAVYGVTQDEIYKSKGVQKFQGNIICSNDKYSQILEHTSKLVYPSGVSMDYYYGQAANQKCLDIMNLSHQKLKSFILSFQPTHQKQQQSSQRYISQTQKILDIVNPQRRVYAICTLVQDFTILNKQMMQSLKSVQSVKSNGKKSTQKNLEYNKIDIKTNNLGIIVTKRAICIFSYFPFFTFFDQMLKNILYSTKIERYIRYKQNGQNIQKVDSKLHSQLIRSKLQTIQLCCNQKQLQMNKLINFEVGNTKLYLSLTSQNCNNYLSEEWAYSILSLFTLDNFLDLYTLLTLQEKIIFVCQDKSILTYAIFLFTKVLTRPFTYPFPIVNLIPDSQDYFNAPFPIIYGYNKTKKQFIQSKLSKKYKNIYIIFQPTGIQMINHDQKMLQNRSPKLRDLLMPIFKKINKAYPNKNLFKWFNKQQKTQFNYQNNKDLALQIINSVYKYMNNSILKLLPTKKQIDVISQSIKQKQDVQEDQINILIYNKIIQKYRYKSRDPYYNAFLKTQIFNVYIFNY